MHTELVRVIVLNFCAALKPCTQQPYHTRASHTIPYNTIIHSVRILEHNKTKLSHTQKRTALLSRRQHFNRSPSRRCRRQQDTKPRLRHRQRRRQRQQQQHLYCAGYTVSRSVSSNRTRAFARLVLHARNARRARARTERNETNRSSRDENGADQIARSRALRGRKNTSAAERDSRLTEALAACRLGGKPLR